MKTLRTFTGRDFYGMDVPQVPGLQVAVRHGTREGHPYSYIIYRDHAGIKWKIIPAITPKGRVKSVRLHHRNRYRRQGFHSQGKWAWGTPKGVRDLVVYIQNHEDYERVAAFGSVEQAPEWLEGGDSEAAARKVLGADTGLVETQEALA